MSAISNDQAFLEAVQQVAVDVAAANADAVDRENRFPHETLDALRASRALSAFIPQELGGGGVSYDVLGPACYQLGRRCAASGMVFAMHQIQVGSIVRHMASSDWFESYLGRVASEQRLIASATSEVGVGGDLRQSIAAVETDEHGGRWFEKQATTVSYGGHADDILTTVRRSPDADRGDQVMVLTHKTQTAMRQTATWDALGMRGTCSPGFVLRAEFAPEQILPQPFAVIAPETMVPWSHLLWAHVWLGIATDAYERARAFVRGMARNNPGTVPAPAQRLARLGSDVARLRTEIDAANREYGRLVDGDNRDELSGVGYALRVNNLKITASEGAADICRTALSICGMAGYKNDTPFSVGRHLRDSLSAALMIANERILATNAQLVLVHKER